MSSYVLVQSQQRNSSFQRHNIKILQPDIQKNYTQHYVHNILCKENFNSTTLSIAEAEISRTDFPQKFTLWVFSFIYKGNSFV